VQRERLIAAVAAAVAERGYPDTSVADILQRSRVSRSSFYEHFANKQECFLAAYEAGVDDLTAAIEAELASAPVNLERPRAGMAAYLRWCAAHPDFARALLIEAMTAGPIVRAYHLRVREAFARWMASLYEEVRSQNPGFPARNPDHFRIIAGGLEQLIIDHILRDGPERLESLADRLHELEYDLLLGRDDAEPAPPRDRRSTARARTSAKGTSRPRRGRP
jgi:AcrR family transcriptional regulator